MGEECFRQWEHEGQRPGGGNMTGTFKGHKESSGQRAGRKRSEHSSTGGRDKRGDRAGLWRPWWRLRFSL